MTAGDCFAAPLHGGMMATSELLVFANWSTLLVCMVLKFPQILAVVSAHSARGLSLNSLLLELTGFLVFLRYQNYYDYPIETYLEYPILIAQDVILLLLICHYSSSLKHAVPYLAVFAAGWHLLALQKWIIDLAMTCCTFISAASKFVQLQCLWQTKDSGQVSALTWSMACYTCATRIFTTLMTTKDMMVLARFIIMLLLNLWVIVTVLSYRRTSKKTDWLLVSEVRGMCSEDGRTKRTIKSYFKRIMVNVYGTCSMHVCQWRYRLHK